MPTIFLNRKSGLYLKNVPGKGRGVFCRDAIKKGDVLETTPSLLLNEMETDHADKTRLENYTFVVGDLSPAVRKQAGIKRNDVASAVLMGVMAFCNHGEKPNACIYWEEEAGTVYYILAAIRDIPAGAEICTTYGNGWFDDRI